MTPAEIARLTNPEKIRRMIRLRESVLRRPGAWGQKEALHREIAALMERHLEITGEEWRP